MIMVQKLRFLLIFNSDIILCILWFSVSIVSMFWFYDLPVGELYRDFFSFWSHFDYDDVIDINEARTTPLSSLAFTEEFRDIPLKVLNTQNEEKNIAFRMNSHYHELFVKYCTQTSDILSKVEHVPTSFSNAHRL